MREACVVGAGVVGITTAWYLAEAGWKVSMVDKANAVGTGASYMNGGQLSYRYVSPLADAGVPFKALKWLIEADGPLRFKPRADLAQWTWLATFLLSCNKPANRRTTERLARLGAHSRASMNKLLAEHALPDFSWRESGKLVVYRSKPTFERAMHSIPASDIQEVLDADACLAKEPAIAALHSQLCGGIFTPGEAVADCHAFCVGLQRKLESHPNFAELTKAEALGFEPMPGKRLRLLTSQGAIESENFILAAGTASRRLGATLGMRLPIYPLKGYSLNVPIGTEHLAPTTSVTDFERKTLYARIGDHLRIAAMVDMVGESDAIDPVRIASLMRTASRDMPMAGDYGKAVQWAGLRPATPDGAPIVGRSPVPGLWFNTGHGPLGFTFACGTASLLASVMTGEKPSISLDGLSWPNR